MQVTRQRREVSRVRLGFPKWVGRRLRIVVAGTAAVLVVGGGMAAYGSTVGFGDNQVGTQYPNGIQVSDDQIINPIGDRLLTQFGKFMGSTVSPDGRFLAATSADKSVVLQIFDLSSLQAHLDGRHRIRGQPDPVRRHGRTGRPDVLAGRQVPLASGARRPDPVPGQPRRHPRYADPLPAPDGGQPPFW